jgi:hypothetical protein
VLYCLIVIRRWHCSKVSGVVLLRNPLSIIGGWATDNGKACNAVMNVSFSF